MTNPNERNLQERRKHKRFKVKSGTFKSGNITGEIVDISMGGLSFSYVDNDDWTDENFDCGMLMGEKDLCLEQIPMKIISDCAINTGLSITRRCGVKFEKLTPKQLAQLEFFIWTNTDAPKAEITLINDVSS